jgi:hypothetical protein
VRRKGSGNKKAKSESGPAFVRLRHGKKRKLKNRVIRGSKVPARLSAPVMPSCSYAVSPEEIQKA